MRGWREISLGRILYPNRNFEGGVRVENLGQVVENVLEDFKFKGRMMMTIVDADGVWLGWSDEFWGNYRNIRNLGRLAGLSKRLIVYTSRVMIPDKLFGGVPVMPLIDRKTIKRIERLGDNVEVVSDLRKILGRSRIPDLGEECQAMVYVGSNVRDYKYFMDLCRRYPNLEITRFFDTGHWLR